MNNYIFHREQYFILYVEHLFSKMSYDGFFNGAILTEKFCVGVPLNIQSVISKILK